MAKADTTDLPIDDLDAFFSAAASDDPLDIRLAAENVAKNIPAGIPGEYDNDEPLLNIHPNRSAAETAGGTRSIPRRETFAGLPDDQAEALTENREAAGRFIALDPETLGADSNATLVLVPAGIHRMLPWWVWLTIGLGLVVMAAGVVVTPMLNLDRLVSRLDDSNAANVQHIMRQLVVKGDQRTVDRLYRTASSPREKMTVRLRAVDTLSLIDNLPEADRALLRLELSDGTDRRVRDAAVAARRQREAARARRGK